MRIETKKPVVPVFEEIHIILESKEEVQKMEHYLRMDRKHSLEQYCESHSLVVRDMDKFVAAIWSDLDDILKELEEDE